MSGIRLNVELSPKAASAVRILRAWTGARSYAEVVRKAIAIAEAVHGKQIILRDPAAGRENRMLYIE